MSTPGASSGAVNRGVRDGAQDVLHDLRGVLLVPVGIRQRIEATFLSADIRRRPYQAGGQRRRRT